MAIHTDNKGEITRYCIDRLKRAGVPLSESLLTIARPFHVGIGFLGAIDWLVREAGYRVI